MAKPVENNAQVDVTYVKRGQLSEITRLRPEPSPRALEAVARARARAAARRRAR